MQSVTHAPRSSWKVIGLASLGGALELYDFIIYGVFAMQIATQFFPSIDPVAALLSTFGVFAIGYISRPLGGVILSSFGDRYGRRVVFIVSIMGMSLCTLGIGLVPTYETIGIWAPVILILLRLAQGFFLAGELPCSITYVVEEIPHRASFVSGLVIFCLNLGVLVATLVNLALHQLFDAREMTAFGWRIAFILGGCLGIFSYWVRRTLAESHEFQTIKSETIRQPFRHVIKNHGPSVITGICLAAIANASNTMLFVVLPSYMTNVLKLDPHAVSVGQNLGVAIMSVSLLFVAWLGDRIPPHRLHRIGCLLILFGSYPLYSALVTHVITPLQMFLALGVIGGFVNGTYAYLLATSFPTQVRFSGIALSLNLTTVIFTGSTPLVITSLIAATGSSIAPAGFIMTVAVISVAAGFVFHRNRTTSMAVSA